jgi:predicted transcriptional regulator
MTSPFTVTSIVITGIVVKNERETAGLFKNHRARVLKCFFIFFCLYYHLLSGKKCRDPLTILLIVTILVTGEGEAMSSSSRFTIALHILTWMTLVTRKQKIVTSDQIAANVNTNPVFIRRILGLLEKAQLVIVQHGMGRGIQPAVKRFYEEAKNASKQQFAQTPVADILRETLTPSP